MAKDSADLGRQMKNDLMWAWQRFCQSSASDKNRESPCLDASLNNIGNTGYSGNQSGGGARSATPAQQRSPSQDPDLSVTVHVEVKQERVSPKSEPKPNPKTFPEKDIADFAYQPTGNKPQNSPSTTPLAKSEPVSSNERSLSNTPCSSVGGDVTKPYQYDANWYNQWAAYQQYYASYMPYYASYYPMYAYGSPYAMGAYPPVYNGHVTSQEQKPQTEASPLDLSRKHIPTKLNLSQTEPVSSRLVKQEPVDLSKKNTSLTPSFPVQLKRSDIRKVCESPGIKVKQAADFYECDRCPKQFRYRYLLRRHILRHTGELPHKCSYCDRRFMYPVLLRAHMNTHDKNNQFRCEECGKNFVNEMRLERHLFTHKEIVKTNGFSRGKQEPVINKTQVKRECKVKTFRKNILNLKKTAVRLVKQKTHRCRQCCRSFTAACKLKVHGLIKHKKKQAFQTFNKKNGSKVTTIQDCGQKKFQCCTCGKRFPSKATVFVHQLAHARQKSISVSTNGVKIPIRCAV